jgi:hypothetical protein
MQPGDVEDLAARIRRLEAELEAMGGRRDEREALEKQVFELESEIDAARARLDGRGPRRRSLLDNVRIASPCTASWEDMTGDDRSRHCKACDRPVFSLSAMTRLDAEQFLVDNQTACVRLYRRFDGTVITSDCPVGRRRMRVRNVIAIAGSAAALAAIAILRADPPARAASADPGLEQVQRAAERVAGAALRAIPPPRHKDGHWIAGGLRYRPPHVVPQPTKKPSLSL